MIKFLVSFVLLVCLISFYAFAQGKRVYGPMSTEEHKKMNSQFPDVPELDSFSYYVCSDICIECQCGMGDSYKHDSTVYNLAVAYDYWGTTVSFIVYRYDRMESRVTFYDSLQKKTISSAELVTQYKKIYHDADEAVSFARKNYKKR